MDREVVVAGNSSVTDTRGFEVIVDITLNRPGTPYRVLYSNKPGFRNPGAVADKAAGTVASQEVDGSSGVGPLRFVRVSLRPSRCRS